MGEDHDNQNDKMKSKNKIAIFFYSMPYEGNRSVSFDKTLDGTLSQTLNCPDNSSMYENL